MRTRKGRGTKAPEIKRMFDLLAEAGDASGRHDIFLLVPPSLRAKTTILDRSLSKGKQEVSLAAFALLFSETVQYCQARSSTVPELQGKLHDLGWQV